MITLLMYSIISRDLSFRGKYTISFAGPCEKDKLNLGANYDFEYSLECQKRISDNYEDVNMA